MSKDGVLEYFRLLSMHRMVSHHLPKLLICLDSLEMGDIWDSGDNGTGSARECNSIGGIILHILEQVTRHTVRLAHPELPYDGTGITDYFPNIGMKKEMLAEQVQKVFVRLQETLETVEEDHIDLYNLYHLVEHTSYHTGQIIDRTQRITGIKFQFVQNGIHEKALRQLVDSEFGGQKLILEKKGE